MPTPSLLTFDIFGTILDWRWRTGHTDACAAAGYPPGDGDFDRIVDAQTALQQVPYGPYSEITAQSLIETLQIPPETAAAIGATIGTCGVYRDARLLAEINRAHARLGVAIRRCRISAGGLI